MRNAYRKNLKGRDHFEDLDVDGSLILEWILEKWGESVRIGYIWLGSIETSVGLL